MIELMQHVHMCMQSMDVSKFWDLMINALKAANEVSPLNKK